MYAYRPGTPKRRKCAGGGGDALSQVGGGGDQQVAEVSVGLGARLDGGVAGRGEHADGLHRCGGVLGAGGALTGQRLAGGGLGVDGVVLAAAGCRVSLEGVQRPTGILVL